MKTTGTIRRRKLSGKPKRKSRKEMRRLEERMEKMNRKWCKIVVRMKRGRGKRGAGEGKEGVRVGGE